LITGLLGRERSVFIEVEHRPVLCTDFGHELQELLRREIVLLQTASQIHVFVTKHLILTEPTCRALRIVLIVHELGARSGHRRRVVHGARTRVRCAPGVRQAQSKGKR
jgi:hypothetical protein